MIKGRVLLGGGTGLVGRALSALLVKRGYEVIVLTRGKKKAKGRNVVPGISFAEWDVDKMTIDDKAINSANVIINLAGAGVVDKPWTDAYKKLVLDSRVNSCATIVKALNKLPNSVETVINVSAMGYYGNDRPGQGAFIETNGADNSFLGNTCRLWEESIKPVMALNRRLVIFRLGIVLSAEGGAMKEFLKPLKFRLASVLGSGKQMVSWIHMNDLCEMILYAIENNRLSGVYNAVAPLPVTNKQLTVSLAKTMYGTAFITVPVPAFVLKLMLGERSTEVLKSTTVSSKKIEDAGYDFLFRDIDSALRDLIRK